MKTYHYAALIVVLGVIVAALVYAGQSARTDRESASCLSKGGSFNYQTRTCQPTTAAGGNDRSIAGTAKPTLAPTSRVTYQPASAAQMIRVTSPLPGATLSPTMSNPITGQAVGPWFSEASFPVQLLDAQGKIISRGNVMSQGTWMTESFVGFSGAISFVKQPSGSRGYLLLLRDNPSGLPQNDATVTIPIIFK